MPPEARFAAAMQALVGEGAQGVGLAVSGGGDSIALLHLAARWAGAAGGALHVATVDHGLRPGSADEVAAVARAAGSLGLPHDILRWTGWDGRGNLQDRARRARARLLGGWARDRGLAAIATGHTLDDQAETVLMRLARGSGVDGLGGMAASVCRDGTTWVRPLLGLRRADLRGWLQAAGANWAEDPSNDDPRFDRVRARALLDAAALDPVRLVATAHRMDDARDVLEDAARALAACAVRRDGPMLVLNAALMRAARADTRNRLLARAVMWTSGATHRPRFAALMRLADAGEGTLQGCTLTTRGPSWLLFREWNAVRDIRAAPDAPWDGRWRMAGRPRAGQHVAALGHAGLAACPDRRATGRPASALLAAPAVWEGDRLVAAPHAGLVNHWSASLVRERGEFAAVGEIR